MKNTIRNIYTAAIGSLLTINGLGGQDTKGRIRQGNPEKRPDFNYSASTYVD